MYLRSYILFNLTYLCNTWLAIGSGQHHNILELINMIHTAVKGMTTIRVRGMPWPKIGAIWNGLQSVLSVLQSKGCFLVVCYTGLGLPTLQNH